MFLSPYVCSLIRRFDPRSLKGPVAGLLLPGKGGGRTCEKFCYFRVVIL